MVCAAPPLGELSSPVRGRYHGGGRRRRCRLPGRPPSWHRDRAVSPLALRLTPTLLLLATSCSSVYEITFAVTLADDVSVPPGAFIAFVAAEGADIASLTARAQIPVTQGVRNYQGRTTVCCAPEPTVHLHAFIDFDGDRMLDPDEPRGADPNNPAKLTDTTKAYRSAVVITRPPSAP